MFTAPLRAVCLLERSSAALTVLDAPTALFPDGLGGGSQLPACHPA